MAIQADFLCVSPSAMEEALKLLKNLEEKENENHKLILVYDDTYLYIGRKNEKQTCKFTIRIPYEVPQNLLEEEVIKFPLMHWECSLLEFRDAWKNQGLKRDEIASMCFVIGSEEEEGEEEKEEIALFAFTTKKSITPITLLQSKGRLVYNPNKLQLESFPSHQEWFKALGHAMEVTAKEEDVRVVINPVRFAITNNKQIYYYINPTPISHWVLTRDILAIMYNSIQEPVQAQQRQEQLFLFEERKGYDVLYHIILSDNTEAHPIEQVNFHKEYQSTFHINATHVARYLENLENISKIEIVEEGFALRFIPHIEKDIKPVVWETPVDELPLVNEVYIAVYQMIKEEEKNEKYIDWQLLKKKINKYVAAFKKEREKDILSFIEPFVVSSDKKEMFKLWGTYIKKLKEELYLPYKQKEEVFPILKEHEGDIKDSLFDLTQLRAFFFQKEGGMIIERRLYSNVFGKEGYLWTHSSEDDESALNSTGYTKQYLTGYTKPPVDLIEKLIDLGILYYFVDEEGNLTVDTMPRYYVDHEGIINQIET